MLYNLGGKFMSFSHAYCQELCQQASWLMIGWARVNDQSEARSASWPYSWPWFQLISFHLRASTTPPRATSTSSLTRGSRARPGLPTTRWITSLYSVFRICIQIMRIQIHRSACRLRIRTRIQLIYEQISYTDCKLKTFLIRSITGRRPNKTIYLPWVTKMAFKTS